jgi:outer membrane protein OmpA-like peptidoglycan-associated protein
MLAIAFASMDCVAQEIEEEYNVQNVEFNSSNSDFAAIHVDDELVLYSSDKKSSGIFVPYNEETGKGFSNVYSNTDNEKVNSLLEVINSRFHDASVAVNDDFNLVFFTRSADQNVHLEDSQINHLNIFYTTFEDGLWTKAKPFPLNSNEYSCLHPCLSPEEDFLYFASDMEEDIGSANIYRIPYYGNDQWGEAVKLSGNVNSDYKEIFPFVDDDNVLYFSSNRPQEDSSQIFNVYRVYPMGENQFSNPERLPAPINSIYNDFSFSSHLRFDGSEVGFFSSDRPRGSGEDDIYQWTRNLKPLRLIVKVENRHGKALTEAAIKIIDENGVTETLFTDNDGILQKNIDRKQEYLVEIEHDNYQKTSFPIEDISNETLFISRTIVLEPVLLFAAQPVDTAGNLLSGVRIKIQGNDYEIEVISDEDGVRTNVTGTDFDENNFKITFSKEGYVDLDIDLTEELISEEGILLPQELTVMHPEPQNLDNVYFAYDKSYLTKQAKAILDKYITESQILENQALVIQTHADCRGGDEYNMKLSQRRAQSIFDYLINHGVDEQNIRIEAFGESKAKVECDPCNSCNEQQHAQNRRGELLILYKNHDI